MFAMFLLALKRYWNLLFFAILIFFSFIKLSYAGDIGVSPAIVTINFEPGLKQTMNFKFLGDVGGKYDIYVEGDLKDYVGINKEIIYGPDDVNVILELPGSIEPPGTHMLKVGIKEIFEAETILN